MTYQPVYATRSYGGGAVPAALVNFMGATDTQFTITPTTGWVENDGSPLGTSGPFVVIIDRFTETVEKIECSSINLDTGVVIVYTSGGYSGRGFDTDTDSAQPGTGQPQGHQATGIAGQVQTCWSSIEALEANQAVVKVFGPSQAIASGEMYSTSTANIANDAWTDVAMVPINLSGGMMASGNNLVVPSAGRYLVCGQGAISVATGDTGFQTGCFSSATASLRLYGNSAVADASDEPANIGSTFSKVIVCAASEELKLQVIQFSSPTAVWPLYFVANEVTNWFTVTYLGP